MRPSKDLTNQKFGRLTAIKRIKSKKNAKWLCKCDCGNTVEVYAFNLTRGNTKSCGCYHKDRTSEAKLIHGERYTRLFNIWAGMKARCYNKTDPSYKNYGGRGISVCEEWRKSFVNFRDWAKSNGYKDSLTIDRIDNNGNYCPENCRWATAKQQSNNRRSNVYVTINGETHTVTEWSEINGISYHTIASRRRKGWSDVDAVTIVPFGKR